MARIVVRCFEVVDVLRQLLRVGFPEACLVDGVQIGIEDGYGFEGKYLVNKFGELRTGLHVQVQLQGSAGELVEVLHLVTAGIGLARMVGDARGEPADDQGHENEDDERDGVDRIRSHSGLRLMRGGKGLRCDCRKRHDDRLPKAAQQGDGNNDEQIQQDRDGKQPAGPLRERSDHGDCNDAEKAFKHEEKHTSTGEARMPHT